MEEKSGSVSISDLEKQIARLKRRIDREVTARKSAERLLEEKSLELYQSNRKLARLNESLEKTVHRRTNTLASLIKNLQTGILLEDENRKVLLVNEKLCEYLGLEIDPKQLIGEDFTETPSFIDIFDDDSAAVERRMQALYDNRKIDSLDAIRLKNGRVMRRDFIPIYSDEDYLGQLWKFQDITQQYQYEERIRQSEEKYRGIIENMELGLIEVDLDHNIIKAYDWFCDMTGYAHEELIGKNMRELFLPKEYDQKINDEDNRRKQGEPSIYEIQMRRKDGRLIWVLISGAPIYDTNDNVVGSIGIHYDITDRKSLENELREAREMAEKAREAEKQFLANMSHEIRNPINAIAGIINLLYDTKLSSEQLEYLNNIKYAADILLGLISDILDISKIEAGQMELNEREIDLAEVLNAIIQTSRFKSTSSNLEFNCEIDEQLKIPLIADPTMINQIFLNLIGNSIKFTEEGEIRISASLLKDHGEEVEVVCKVEDTGIGISEEQMQNVFEKFKQASKETKLKYGGTGLGLSIVKQLVELYQGKISVESEEGEGTSFIFTMIFSKSEDGKEINIIAEKDQEDSVETLKKVLVVEDNKINQQYLVGLLKRWEIPYDIANNGAEALSLIEKSSYDTVLMDIRMPVMDGYEATIRIRNLEHNANKHVPIIALTASALVDEKQKALDAGMNYHLTKPFAPDQLLSILYQINNDASGSSVNLADQPVENTFQFNDSLDTAYLDSLFGDDLERAAIMFGIFTRTMSSEIAQLRDQLAAGDFPAVREIAHRIKPNFAMVGLTEETDRMKIVEEAADRGDENTVRKELDGFFQTYPEKMSLIQSELDRIQQELS